MSLSNNFSQKATNYERYAVTQRSSAQSLAEQVLKFLPQKKLKIADLGCGPGTMSQFLIPRLTAEYELVNCDLSTEMLKLAKKNLPYSKSIIFENQSKPSSSGFDLIVSNFALQWYNDIEETLKACLKKLRHNGLLAISLPVKESFSTLEKSFKKVGIAEKFFNFPREQFIRKVLSGSGEIVDDTLREEKESYPGTKEFLRNLHEIGANRLNQAISTAQLRKLIRYHDELFDDNIIVSYIVYKIIIRKVPK